jgi:hypothetical protein
MTHLLDLLQGCPRLTAGETYSKRFFNFKSGLSKNS